METDGKLYAGLKHATATIKKGIIDCLTIGPDGNITEVEDFTSIGIALPDDYKPDYFPRGSEWSLVHYGMTRGEVAAAREEAACRIKEYQAYAKKEGYKNFKIAPVKIARPNVACRAGETNEPTWEEVYVKSHSETVKIVGVHEIKLPESPKARAKQAKNFTIDVTAAQKAYIAGHDGHTYGELRLIYGRDDTTMFNKTTDSLDDESRQDRDLSAAKKKATRHVRSASVSPELLRTKVGSRLMKCHLLDETTGLLTKDPAIESINHVFGTPYLKRPNTPKEANRFNDLLSRLAAQGAQMADPAIVAIKPVITDKSDPREEADKLVAAQEQLAEKARFKRSDSGYLSPPLEGEDGQTSGPSSATAATTPEQTGTVIRKKEASADSGIHTPTERSTLNPEAMEFISSRAPVKVKDTTSFVAATQGMPRAIKPLIAPAPIVLDQILPPPGLTLPPMLPPPSHHLNIAPYQEMPAFRLPAMHPPLAPAYPPRAPFLTNNRPHSALHLAPLPVTIMPTLRGRRPALHRKPRGHNAAEQQQYEAWLEYKRSTDLTFHQKGKDRQLRRAGRQN